MNTILSNPWLKLAAVVGGAYFLYKKASNPLIKGVAMTVGSLAIAKQIPIVRDTI
jgi:hypothetical protein